MSKKAKPPTGGGRRNPVARHANKINRPAAFSDHTRYRRAAKHKGAEPFASLSPRTEKGLRKISGQA
jgi:hypothetical protein